MIEINLLPEGLRKKETVKITMPDIPIKKTLTLVFGAVLGLQVLFTLFTFYSRIEAVSLTKRIAALKEADKEIQSQKSETLGIYSRLKEVRSVTARKFYWTSLLSAVSNSMTKGVWLRGLYVTEEEPKSSAEKNAPPDPSAKKGKGAAKKETPDRFLVLEGSAAGQGQETAFIGKFLKQLKDNPFFAQLFSDIKPYNINQRRLKDFDVYDFMIYCRFRREKA